MGIMFDGDDITKQGFIIFISGVILVFGGLWVVMDYAANEVYEEKQEIKDMSCSELKYYALDTNKYKALVEKQWLWNCER